MSSATFYNRRTKYCGMDASLMNRMNELEAENRRLKKMCADERLKAEIVRGRAQKIVRPSCRREMARMAVEQRSISIRRACRAFRISANCYRYQRKHSGENAEMAGWQAALTRAYRSSGFGLCFLYLRNVKGTAGTTSRSIGSRS